MIRQVLSYFRTLVAALDTGELQRVFLAELLRSQNVERGSIWVRSADGFICIEAAGDEADKVRGVIIPRGKQSVVRWVIEHGEMAIVEAGKDRRHYKALESSLDVKSTLILCYPLILTGGEGPCGVRGEDDPEYTVIVMPMKIVEETYYSEEGI